MSKLIEVVKGYKIIQGALDFIVVNTAGEYRNHGHFKKLSTCYRIIRLIEKRTVPRSEYLIESARRITTDPKYLQALINKQEKNRNRQYYYNPSLKKGRAS